MRGLPTSDPLRPIQACQYGAKWIVDLECRSPRASQVPSPLLVLPPTYLYRMAGSWVAGEYSYLLPSLVPSTYPTYL